jgi:uncharacterized membrane protein YoaK (UPF0700 family)
MIAFAISLGLSLALVALTLPWARALFAVLSVVLVVANVDSALRVRGVKKATGSTALLAKEVLATAMVVVLIVTPWALGGLHPTREDLTWAILLSFAAGFLSISATVMSALDIARLEVTEPTEDDPAE